MPSMRNGTKVEAETAKGMGQVRLIRVHIESKALLVFEVREIYVDET